MTELILAFPRYVYTDAVFSHLTSENVMAVVYAAKKYAMAMLLAECEKFLVDNLGVDQAVVFLSQVHFHCGAVFRCENDFSSRYSWD